MNRTNRRIRPQSRPQSLGRFSDGLHDHPHGLLHDLHGLPHDDALHPHDDDLRHHDGGANHDDEATSATKTKKFGIDACLVDLP